MRTGSYCKCAVELISETGSILRLELWNPDERRHKGWVHYDIAISPHAGCTPTRLSDLVDPDHFFDDKYEPEIPQIISRIYSTLCTGNELEFEPLDERDFRFEIRPISNLYFRIRVIFAHGKDSGEWQNGCTVSREAINAFAANLSTAYQRIRRENNPPRLTQE